jgi:hypothetical protein
MEKRTSGPKLFWYFGWLFSFFYIVLFESLPNTRFICMRVGCPRTRPRHGTFYTKRKKGGPWPTREGIGKNHWTCAEFYYIKRRDWRVYTCVCVCNLLGEFVFLFYLTKFVCEIVSQPEIWRIFVFFLSHWKLLVNLLRVTIFF